MGISDFQISGQSLIKEKCHNSRTSNDIDMKLGAVTKLDKLNTATSKTFDVDVIFPIYGQSRATRKPYSGSMVCKTYILIDSNLLSYKN